MIIVTGGLGFIGSHLVYALQHHGADVVIVDTEEAYRRVRGIPPRARIVNASNLFGFMEENRPDAIFHMGAISSTTAKGPEVFQTNTSLTTHLFRWCGKHDVPLLYASSASTYGNGEQGFDDELSLYEAMALRPLNSYGLSKHLADLFCMGHTEIFVPPPPRWYGCKFFNVYGPGEFHKGPQRSVISRWVSDASRQLPIGIFDGTFSAARDFIAVSDVVEICIWLLMSRKPESGIYNVGTGRPTSFADVLHTVLHHFPDHRWQTLPMPEELAPHYQRMTQASTTKLKRAGYVFPLKTLSEGIESVIEEWHHVAE